MKSMKAIATVSMLAAGFVSLGNVTTSAGAVILANYGFGTAALPSYASTDVDTNSVATNFAPAAGLGSTGNWNSTENGIDTVDVTEGNPPLQFAQKPLTTTTESGAQQNNAYWSFTLTPASGYAVNLTSFSFDLVIHNSGLPISYYLATSVGGFTNPVGAVVTNQGSSSHPTFDLSAAAFQNLTTPLELRLYQWSSAGHGSSGSRWTFDNVMLNGTTSPVPEPASLMLLSAALGLGLRPRRGK
jgi:hypothetical protein